MAEHAPPVDEARQGRLETTVPTPYGDGRLVVAEAADPVATLLLSHGAGNGIESHDLAALMAALPGSGVTVARLRPALAGRRPQGRDRAADARRRPAGGGRGARRRRAPLVVGGRSAGARSAARCARDLGAVGCLALSFPLHPPGRPERTRLDELAAAGVPTLVVQGERDAMGRPEEFPALAGRDARSSCRGPTTG